MIKRFFEGFLDDFYEKIAIGFAFSILLSMIIGAMCLLAVLTSWVFPVSLIIFLLVAVIIGHIIIKYIF